MPEILLPAVELVAVVLGVTALIVLFAMYLPAKVLHAVLGHVWLVGSHIAGAIEHWLYDAMGAVAGWMKDLTVATMHLIWAMVSAPWWLASALVGAIANALSWGINAYSHADVVGNDVLGFATSGLSALSGQIGTIEQALQGEITGIGNDVAGISADVAGQVAAGVDLAETQAERVAKDATNAAVLPLEAELAGVQALTGEFQGELQGLEALIPPWIGTVPDLINGAIAGVLDQANSHADAVAQQAAAAAGTIAQAGAIAAVLTEVMPAVDALTVEAETCLAPLCDGAGQLGSLGSLLKLLEALFGAAALTALLVEAVRDPKACGDAIRETMGWASDAGEGMAHLIFDLAHVQL
jgi:hypothetical protein